MIKVVYDFILIREKVDEWLRNNTDEYVYSLPRHHPLLVQAVENVARDPDMYIREIEGTQYSIWSDRHGNEQIWTPEDFNWVEVVINEKEQE